MYSREGSPSKLGDRKVPGENLKNTDYVMVFQSFLNPYPIKGMYRAQAPKGETNLLAIEAIAVRS